jgi:hypothetical protein
MAWKEEPKFFLNSFAHITAPVQDTFLNGELVSGHSMDTALFSY